jgi:hypothetical protein
VHRILRRPLQILFWKTVRRWPASGSFTPPWNRLQQPNVLRWSLYRKFLERNQARFDRVLMVDLRDVFFQSDPFEHDSMPGLRVFAEEGDFRVCDSDWNARTMKLAFGRKTYRNLSNLRVFCSGAMMGDVSSAQSYLAAYASMLQELEFPDHGTDQAIHIRLVDCLKDNLEKVGNQHGEAINLHFVRDLASIPRDADGRFLNAGGKPFSIIHQYDRHPELLREVRKRFPCHTVA